MRRTTLALIGMVAFFGTELALAAGNPQQAPATAQPAAAQPDTAATPAPAQPAAPLQKPALSPEQKAVVETVEAFDRAYSAADVKALADLFTEDASVVNPEGAETRGNAAIAQMYTASFPQAPGLKLESHVEDIRFITPDVARVEGQSRLTSANTDATEFTRFSTLLVRRDGKWRAAEIRESVAPVADIPPYERLKELEWMVGDWVDESENNKVQASIRWADNQSYLIRTYTVEIQGEKASSGTMFIGWDPQSGQIKSWVFDSDGGHGEALWTRTADNQWVVKATGVLRDGQPTSATQIHTIINKDSVKTSSIDRIIGGQVAPDIAEIVMVRKPPQPSAAAPKPAAAVAPK
jgi:uncharacterized protein (TIGR02246 family)